MVKRVRFNKVLIVLFFLCFTGGVVTAQSTGTKINVFKEETESSVEVISEIKTKYKKYYNFKKGIVRVNFYDLSKDFEVRLESWSGSDPREQVFIIKEVGSEKSYTFHAIIKGETKCFTSMKVYKNFDYPAKHWSILKKDGSYTIMKVDLTKEIEEYPILLLTFISALNDFLID